jgi:hypothetical protein
VGGSKSIVCPKPTTLLQVVKNAGRIKKARISATGSPCFFSPDIYTSKKSAISPL